MERTPAPRLKPGDRLDGVVVKSVGGRRFVLKCPSLPSVWKVVLHTKTPERVEEGANISVWIAKVIPVKMEVLVHDGDFGRLPISEAMRVRYVSGLRAVLGAAPVTGDNLADARSIFARLEQRKDADWLTVWKVVGEPEPGDIQMVLQAIDAIRNARKENPEAVPELQQALDERFGEPLRAALRRLERDEN